MESAAWLSYGGAGEWRSVCHPGKRRGRQTESCSFTFTKTVSHFHRGWKLWPNPWLQNSLPWAKHSYSAAAAAKSLQSCLTLCDPIDGSPPGSTNPGILQARTLEWVAISFSKAWKWKAKVESLSHASVHGIFQTRVLGLGAIAFSYSYSRHS